MTYQDDFTLSAALLAQGSLEQLSAQGLGALPDLFPALLNATMQIERQKHLGAAPHKRTPERTGYANGYKDKTLNTRLGQITVAVPQVREVNGRRRLLSAVALAWNSLRAGSEASPGRNVRSRGLHPQRGRYHRAALRICCFVYPSKPSRKAA